MALRETTRLLVSCSRAFCTWTTLCTGTPLFFCVQSGLLRSMVHAQTQRSGERRNASRSLATRQATSLSHSGQRPASQRPGCASSRFSFCSSVCLSRTYLKCSFRFLNGLVQKTLTVYNQKASEDWGRRKGREREREGERGKVIQGLSYII